MLADGVSADSHVIAILKTNRDFSSLNKPNNPDSVSHTESTTLCVYQTETTKSGSHTADSTLRNYNECKYT